MFSYTLLDFQFYSVLLKYSMPYFFTLHICILYVYFVLQIYFIVFKNRACFVRTYSRVIDRKNRKQQRDVKVK